MSTPQVSDGRFTSVVQTTLHPSPGAIALSTDYSGLDIVVKSAVRAAHSAVIGLGGAQNVHATTISNMASTVSRLLEVRNIAEQLKELGIYTKYTDILTTTELILLEPVTRAYNYYGSFYRHDKRYLARGLEDRLAAGLIKLCAQVNYEQLNNQNEIGMSSEEFSQLNLEHYTIDSSGELIFRATACSFRQRVLDIIVCIAQCKVDPDVRISLTRCATDLSDEISLLQFKSLLLKKGIFPVSHSPAASLTQAHEDGARKLLQQEAFTSDTSISSAVIYPKITVAFSICRHVTSLLSLKMRTLRVGSYRGGTAAQLTTLEDSVLYSEVPLNADEINMAVACSMSVGAAMRFRCCPPEDRDNLIRQLVMQSMS